MRGSVRLHALAVGVVLLLQTAVASCTADLAQPSLRTVLGLAEGHVPLQPDLAVSEAARELVRDMLTGVPLQQGWFAVERTYGVGAPVLREDLGVDSAALDVWTRAVAARVEAYGVLLWDDTQGVYLAAGRFVASPLYKRLEVRRLGASLDGVSRSELLRRLAGCYVTIDTWIELPLSVVEDVIAEQADAYLYAVVDTPDGLSSGRWVQIEDFLRAVRFDHPATEDVDVFSGWFGGRGISPLRLAALAPRVRSNVGPNRLLGIIATMLR